MDGADGIKSDALQAGVTGSIPVTSTNFFLIAKDLEKSPRPKAPLFVHWSAPLERDKLHGAHFAE
jgi:hypothetical protein